MRGFPESEPLAASLQPTGLHETSEILRSKDSNSIYGLYRRLIENKWKRSEAAKARLVSSRRRERRHAYLCQGA